ncbi:MAG: hypothetical protein ACRELF_08880 [Gemmataceae bacterium]
MINLQVVMALRDERQCTSGGKEVQANGRNAASPQREQGTRIALLALRAGGRRFGRLARRASSRGSSIPRTCAYKNSKA